MDAHHYLHMHSCMFYIDVPHPDVIEIATSLTPMVAALISKELVLIYTIQSILLEEESSRKLIGMSDCMSRLHIL